MHTKWISPLLSGRENVLRKHHTMLSAHCKEDDLLSRIINSNKKQIILRWRKCIIFIIYVLEIVRCIYNLNNKFSFLHKYIDQCYTFRCLFFFLQFVNCLQITKIKIFSNLFSRPDQFFHFVGIHKLSIAVGL